MYTNMAHFSYLRPNELYIDLKTDLAKVHVMFIKRNAKNASEKTSYDVLKSIHFN